MFMCAFTRIFSFFAFRDTHTMLLESFYTFSQNLSNHPNFSKTHIYKAKYLIREVKKTWNNDKNSIQPLRIFIFETQMIRTYFSKFIAILYVQYLIWLKNETSYDNGDVPSFGCLTCFDPHTGFFGFFRPKR